MVEKPLKVVNSVQSTPIEQYYNQLIDSLEISLSPYEKDHFLGPSITAIQWDTIRALLSELSKNDRQFSVVIAGQTHQLSEQVMTPEQKNTIRLSQDSIQALLLTVGNAIPIVVVEGFSAGQLSQKSIVETIQVTAGYQKEKGVYYYDIPREEALRNFESDKSYNAVYRTIGKTPHMFFGGEENAIHRLNATTAQLICDFSKPGSQAQQAFEKVASTYWEKLSTLRSLIILAETTKLMRMHDQSKAIIVIGRNHLYDFGELKRKGLTPYITFDQMKKGEQSLAIAQ